MKTTIRELVLSDLSALSRLAAASEREEFLFLTRFVTELTSGQLILESPAHYFVGVFVDDALAAVGGVTADPYTTERGVGRIRHVYVARDARRAGIGSMLMASLEARGRQDYDTLRLRTDTAVAARFYESLGYQRITEAHATHSLSLLL